jgi:hypothetical protein
MLKMNAIGVAVGTMVLGMGMAMAQAPAPAGGASAPAAKGAASAAKGGADKKGPNQGKAGAPSASASAVEALAAAQAMVRYGDANKDPLALIAAAKVMKEVGSRDLGAQRAGGQAGEAKNKPDTATVDAILARAKSLAGSRQDLVAMADDVAKSGSRGAEGGPRSGTTVVRRGATDVFNVTFRGGEPARVFISGDGDTDLDLYVYDENGGLICRDEGPSDDALCRWTPRWTGNFQIRVRNLSTREANQYRISHN